MASSVLLQSLGNGTLQDSLGHALSGHQVYVYLRGTTTQVQVYSNTGLSVPLTQPLTSGANGAGPGGIPGYIAGEQAIDFFDATTSNRTPAEPLAVTDLIGSDGKVGGSGSVGLPASVGNARSTDGTYSLPTPTGVGLELILATVNGVPGLQDIQFNGVSQ